MATLFGALLPPLHELAEQYFWAHMVQHELLVAVAAPLIILGSPLATVIGALPGSIRRGSSAVIRLRPFSAGMRFVLGPVVATVAHAAALLIWHVPALYDASVEHAPVHAAQHASFLLTALMFWSAVLRPRHRNAVLGAPVWLFLMAVLTGGIGALLVFAPAPLYVSYVRAATDAASALRDQQIAGFIMWMPGALVYCAAAVAAFAQLLRRPEDEGAGKSPAPVTV